MNHNKIQVKTKMIRIDDAMALRFRSSVCRQSKGMEIFFIYELETSNVAKVILNSNWQFFEYEY